MTRRRVRSLWCFLRTKRGKTSRHLRADENLKVALRASVMTGLPRFARNDGALKSRSVFK